MDIFLKDYRDSGQNLSKVNTLNSSLVAKIKSSHWRDFIESENICRYWGCARHCNCPVQGERVLLDK